MGLDETVNSLYQRTVRNMTGIITPANAISLSRPLIALYGLENFMDDPISLSLTLGAAFATDAIDGAVARYFGQDKKIGAYVDIAGDRALELVALWYFANEGLIPKAIAEIFTIKGIIVDGLRIYRDVRKNDFSEPLKYGGNSNKIERAAYGVVKATYICGVPIVGEVVNSVLGVVTTVFGVYRGVRSVIDK